MKEKMEEIVSEEIREKNPNWYRQITLILHRIRRLVLFLPIFLIFLWIFTGYFWWETLVGFFWGACFFTATCNNFGRREISLAHTSSSGGAFLGKSLLLLVVSYGLFRFGGRILPFITGLLLSQCAILAVVVYTVREALATPITSKRK